MDLTPLDDVLDKHFGKVGTPKLVMRQKATLFPLYLHLFSSVKFRQ